MTTPLQTHILPSSQHTPLLSPYTLLYINPHINTIYASTPIPNYIPKHILLFIITPLPPLLTLIYSILHSITYSLITTSILLLLTLLTLIAFIITYLKHKHLSLFITNSKVKFILYLITHITFSISAVILRNIIKQTVHDRLFAVRIDFVFVDVDIAYGIMWLLCNYIDYMWYMIINIIVLVVKVPLICVDEYFEVITTCTIVACVCSVIGLSYGMTRLHKELFGIRRIGSVVEDVVNMMGMGMISVDVDVRDDNKKEGKRDVKWNKVVEGNEVLRGMIGEHGEGVEKVFKGMKEINKGIGWEVDKDKGNECENNNDDNNDCICNDNELSKRSGSVTNKSSINKIIISNHNNNYSHSQSHSPSLESSSKVFNIDVNSKHNTSHNILNANNNNNNSSSINCMNTNSLQHTILNHLNIPNHHQQHYTSSLSSSTSSFHTFLSTLKSFSFSSPSPLIYLGTQTFTTTSHSTLLQSPSSYLFLKIFYTYNPILNRITFIFLDESKTNYDDLFKTYIQQISMYLHDFKNPLVTIEEKINQFKDIIDYLPFHNPIHNVNTNTTSISTTNIELLEKQLLNNINFISITASDCVCMVRSYEDFAKGVVSNNQESKLELRSFPLNEIYDYLQEWVTMKIERSGYDVKFIVDLDETVPSKFILCTDKMKLKQILMNILSNAIKFTFEGSITLHIERKEVNDVWYTKFEVEDTGTGMDEDVKRNLFKPFISNNKCKNNKHGCGLGMLISLQNSERLGKGIEVESCEGKGTKMWFYVEEKEISQSHLSTYINVNDVYHNHQQGVKLNRRLFQHSARCINALKGKKFNTQCHYHLNKQQSNSMIINYNNKQYNMFHKSKTLPSTLGSTDDVGVNGNCNINNVHDGKDNNINIEEEEEHKSIHHTNLYNETELYKNPIQILPSHKNIMQSNTSLNSGDTNTNAYPNKKKKSKSEMYWLDKSKTVSKDIVDINISIQNDNDSSQYNLPDITPCLFNTNNMPERKVVDSPILSYYKNPLISPSLNAISVFRPPNYNLLNYTNKSKPMFSQIYNAHATSSSCMAIKKYLKKDCFHSCSTFGEVNNQMMVNFSVLLCDDDKSILSAHTRILNERGVHKVDTIYDGLDLVKMFINGNVNDYDLILLDYSMKCMDGTDAVRIIRFMKENGIGGRCGFNYEVLNKIIFASGALDVVRDIMNDKEGMFKYYNKPINKRDLKKILKECSVIK